MARKLAAKVALSTRIDALCEESLGNAVGIESRAYLEQVLKSEIERPPKRFSGVKKAPAASYNTKKWEIIFLGEIENAFVKVRGKHLLRYES